jgi:trypsin
MRRLLAAVTVGVVALAAVGAPAASASPSATASIIGGKVASIAEFPSLTFIEFSEATGDYSCTGSVVAPRVILTAGHCVESLESSALAPAASYAIATGVADVAKATRANVSRVSRVLVYPGFRPSRLTGDAGLLILPAPVSAPALPLASATDAGLLATGTPLSIVGWGLTDPRDQEGPTALHAGTTTVQPADYCKQRSRGYSPFYSPTLQLCAVDRSGHSARGCYGDSGGPAIAHRADGTAVEVGVASSVKPGCIASFPTLFTRADQINAWVSGWIAAVESGGPAPAVKIPRAHLPPLTVARAQELAFERIEKDFGSRFHGVTSEFFCAPAGGNARLRCKIAWPHSGIDYFGEITVFFLLRRNSVIAGEHYRIRSTRRGCLNHSARPRTCPLQTATG